MELARKKPARYFDSEQIDQKDVEKIPINKIGKKKLKAENDFVGDIIKVENSEKPFKKFRKNYTKPQVDAQKRKFYKPEIDSALLKKHSRGKHAVADGVKTNYFKEKLKKKEIYINYATEQAARAELLLTEEHGFIEPGDGERTVDYRQDEIIRNVDITSASKHFKLNLDFGPYKHRYTKNGRHLLLGGKRGHIAAFDWVTKKLHCEINVMEEVADVAWLHIETMFACAQKSWTFIYDKKGIELHCVKPMNNINVLEFLPYHFLLAGASNKGHLTWLDITLGEVVGNYNTKLGEIRIMKQNPTNGVLYVGGGKGVVSMWSPKIREPMATMLCHSTPLSALAIDPKGLHMVTAGLDRRIKVWDVRNLAGPLDIYNLRLPANQMAISQRGALAFSMGNLCEIYTNVLIGDKRTPYLRESVDDFIYSLRFCPYEDILGVSSGKGFNSFLVPGSGEPNFDSFEANPFQSKSQRKENEVHAILEKIPPELITLDPTEIAGVDVETLQQKVDAKKNVFFLKPPKIDFNSRRKMKGKGGTVKAARNKQIVKDLRRKEFIQDLRQTKKQIIASHGVCETSTPEADFIPLENSSKKSVLDRFKTKKNK